MANRIKTDISIIDKLKPLPTRTQSGLSQITPIFPEEADGDPCPAAPRSTQRHARTPQVSVPAMETIWKELT